MESADQTEGVVELLAIEEELDRAIVDADLARIGEILDEDWVIVGPDGALIDRSAFMAAIQVRQPDPRLDGLDGAPRSVLRRVGPGHRPSRHRGWLPG